MYSACISEQRFYYFSTIAICKINNRSLLQICVSSNLQILYLQMIIILEWSILNHPVFLHSFISSPLLFPTVSPSILPQPPQDWMLIAAIGVFLAIDLVFLIIVTGVPQTRTVATKFEPVGAMHIRTVFTYCRVYAWLLH